MLNAWQEQVDNKISSAKSITASGDGYIRFADGTQICWLKFNGWSRKGYDNYFRFLCHLLTQIMVPVLLLAKA